MAKITFNGSATIQFNGEMDIPDEMIGRINPDDYWSLEIDKHIKERFDPAWLDQSGADDVVIEDVTIKKPDAA